MPTPVNNKKYTVGELRTLNARIRQAVKTRQLALPDPDDFVRLMNRVREKQSQARPKWKDPRGGCPPVRAAHARF